jgi:hypothetical protein
MDQGHALQGQSSGSKTMAKLRDLVCLGLWVFSYRAIVLIFLLLRKFEGKRQGTRQLPGGYRS